MKGDFSKDSYKPSKHYHDVRMQQGRVLLDADWNEQVAIEAHRTEAGTEDIIGQAGTPAKTHSGFEILPAGTPVGKDVSISAGRFYVDGILCEQEATMLFAAQPDFNATPLPALAADAGRYLFYLDVWQRHITVLEDSALREVALGPGGPDTTTRNKTVWQVKFMKDAAALCSTALPDSVTKYPTGTMKAKVEAASGGGNPCGLVSSGGYRRLENQLYRIEVHAGAEARKDATFKWSRDNGSVQVSWAGVDSVNTNQLIISTPGRDELLGFKSGDWVELVDEKTDLLGQPGIMVQLLKADGTVLTYNTANVIYPAGVNSVNYAAYKAPRIRRWDSPTGIVKLNASDTNTPANWIELEDGVFVQFSGDRFKTGDYWLIPARTATANIEWPAISGAPQYIPPHGIRHHFAKLAVMDFAATGIWTRVSDCRPLFPALTEMKSLRYIGGDGQEARPGFELDNLLQAGVSNGQWPVAGARVKFEVLAGGGGITPAGISLTQSDGMTGVRWKLGLTGMQQARATLIDDGNNIIGLPVFFDAKITPPAMFYVSGDGQEALSGADLPYPLKVGVSYEQWPVSGAKVKFEVIAGGGTLTPANASAGILTAADGTATCNWTLGTAGNQQVKATLLDAGGNPIHLPIIFNAAISLPASGKGCCITVGKDGAYPNINEALLALKDEKNICLCLQPDQTHKLKNPKLSGKTVLKISGNNAIILLEEDLIEIAASQIIFDHMRVAGVSGSERIMLNGVEVDILSCMFERKTDKSTAPFITINQIAAKVTTPTDKPLVAPTTILKSEASAIAVADRAEQPASNPGILAVNLGLPDTKAVFNDGGAILNTDVPATAPVSSFIVGSPCLVRVQDTRITAVGALALGQGVGGYVANNIIIGRVFLQHTEDFVPLKWNDISTDKAGIEKEVLPGMNMVMKAHSLYILHNSLELILTNNIEKVAIPLDLRQASNGSKKALYGYQSLFVTGNVFSSSGNSFAGNFVSLQTNHFFNNSAQQVSTYAIGFKGIFTENIGEALSDNVFGGIETLFASKVIANNLLHVD